MAYCLIEILGIPTAALDNGSNEILRALIHSRISKFYDEFAVLGTDDIMNLPVPAFGGYNAVPGIDAPTVPAHGDKKIGLLHGRQLCALLAYYHHTCVMEKQLVDVMTLTKEGFDIFCMSLYSPQDPIVPFGKILLKSTNNNLSAWQKSIKMDAKAYKEYCDKAYWNQYKKHFINTLDSHSLGHLIDENHVIMNKELNRAQRSWLFKVMQDSFKQPTCKATVTKYEDTKDTQAIWKDIVQEMEKSMAARIHTGVLSTYLTNTKLATQGWKGTQTNWIIHFNEQARCYNEVANDPYTPSMLMQFMENAVSGVPNLKNVLRSLRSSRVAAGVKGDVG
jgi:UDP-2,3-diacylglucosamine pyrophosphatase LpxH